MTDDRDKCDCWDHLEREGTRHCDLKDWGEILD